jgi:hypothetical protein
MSSGVAQRRDLKTRFVGGVAELSMRSRRFTSVSVRAKRDRVQTMDYLGTAS